MDMVTAWLVSLILVYSIHGHFSFVQTVDGIFQAVAVDIILVFRRNMHYGLMMMMCVLLTGVNRAW